MLNSVVPSCGQIFGIEWDVWVSVGLEYVRQARVYFGRNCKFTQSGTERVRGHQFGRWLLDFHCAEPSAALSLVSLCDPGGQYLVALVFLLGMLIGLFGEFVGSQMIRFVVTSSIMSVLRKIVKFSRSIMRALWHGFPSGT
jgi:hypothetical protein